MILSDIGGYYTAMDREYNSGVAKRDSPLSELRIRDIGISTAPFSNQLDQLKARIFQGASTVELGFSGAGKGSMQGHNTTPEMYGKDEREAIRDMAKINKVNLSTHASYSAGHLSGYNPQQGQFSDAMREGTLREIERAIEFAADTAQGGAVVVHTGEFQRPLSESAWNKRDDEFKGRFKMYDREDKEAMIQFVDKETGHVERIGKNTQFYMPEWERDERGNPIKDPATGLPKPLWNPNGGDDHKGGFKMQQMTWEKLEELGKWYAKESKDPRYEKNPALAFMKLNSEMKLQGQSPVLKDYEGYYRDAIKLAPTIDRLYDKRDNLTPDDILKEKELGKDRVTRGITNAAERIKDELASIQKELGSREEMIKQAMRDPRMSESDKTQAAQELQGIIKSREESKRRSQERIRDLIDDIYKENNDMLSKTKDSVVAFHQQIENERKAIDRLVPVEEYAIGRTAETIARAAEFAHQKSEALKKNGMLNSPIYVAPENIFPEEYGAHPEELKRIIQASRDKFIKDNSPRYGEAEARKLAEEHIKATLDIGHAYTWRKYFQDDPKKSFEQNDAEFKKWLFTQLDKLNKDKMIGHIHVSDNFGYEDEHVTPGQGRVPIREFIDKMKKAGIKEVITEGAHQDYKTMLGGWKEMGAPIYSRQGEARRWTDIENSYFGQTRTPYFIFGDYAPNQQEFSLWSQVPLE